MSSDSRQGGNFLTGLILGAIAGVGVFYFLNSTEEGKRIKKKLQEKGKDFLEDLADLVDEIEEKGEEFKRRAQEVQIQLEEKAGGIKEEITQEAKEKLSQIEQLRERGRKAVKFFTRNGKPLA